MTWSSLFVRVRPAVALLFLVPLVLWWMGAAAPARAQTPAADRSCLPPDGELAFDPEGWETDFCERSVPLTEIISGGPPRDGIPPIDDPRFRTVGEADDWLADKEPVIIADIGDEARAYPLQILTWHEIVNDVVGGRSVVVTFCPLCNAALAFERPLVDGERLTFGTSGNLRKSDLVMWDRQTESWWQQFTGEAIVGELTGTKLRELTAPIISWRTFKEEHPQGRVLSRETGYDRPYGRNPYVGYDEVGQRPFMYRGPVDERLEPMARIVGVEADGGARAYPLGVLRERRVVNDTLGGVPLVVFWQEGTASALDEARIAAGRDVGATGVFRRTVEGEVLTFTADEDGRFTDRQTGSTWNVLGRAVAGPLEGTRLDPVVHHDIFWFVWSAFQSEGELYAEP